MNLQRTANGLGWFSIGLGLTEIFAARAVADTLGIRSTALVRAFGVREVVSGIGLLGSERKAPWIWARVAGDALDSAVLVSALAGRKRKNAALAMLAVAPVVIADIVCGVKLSSGASGTSDGTSDDTSEGDAEGSSRGDADKGQGRAQRGAGKGTVGGARISGQRRPTTADADDVDDADDTGASESSTTPQGGVASEQRPAADS